MDEILNDKRFAHVAKDPRFRKIPVAERKVKVDNRFKGMFKDKRFKLKYSVDSRGKPVNLTTNENLKKYYDLSDSDSSESEDDVVDESSETKDDSIKKAGKKEMAGLSKKDVDSDTGESEHSDAAVDKRVQIKVKNVKKVGKNKGLVDMTEKNVSSESNEDEDNDSSVAVNKKGLTGVKSEGKLRKEKQKLKEAAKKGEMSKQKLPDVSEDKGDRKKQGKQKKEKMLEKLESDSDEMDENSTDDEVSDEEDKAPGEVDYARGEGNISSSSSEDEEDSSDESDDDDDQDQSKLDHRWGEIDNDAISVEEATLRLAVCNMDWDRIKAKDIYVLLNSFKPTDGLLKSVKIYPSEYGKKRMAEEEKHGPKELTELKLDSDDDNDVVVEKEGTTYHREKLRQYQLNRLKYYYAVVECDSVQTADHIYKECDAMEYESSATTLDLRFIPDEEMFEETEMKDSCSEMPSSYKPQSFLNAALAQSKVDLTWDETDRDRVLTTTQHFSNKDDDIEDEDLKAYLASSSDDEAPDYAAAFGNVDDNNDESGEDSDEDKQIDKYKKLLNDIDAQEKKKEHDVEMEISWEPGLRETTESLVKKKKESKDSTVWEDYLKKKKEKKKQKIEERKKQREAKKKENESDIEKPEEESDAGMQAFSDDELPDGMDVNELMAEEPTNRSKQKEKKKKKKKKKASEDDHKDIKEEAELSLLMMDEDNKKHFNLQDLVQEEGKKKKKNKQKEQKRKELEEGFKVNVEDPRFSAVYESHLFNIDPSAPEFRKTKGTEAIISEKLKRNEKGNKHKLSSTDSQEERAKKPKLTENKSVQDDTGSLASLIKSVKSKTKHFHSNKIKR